MKKFALLFVMALLISPVFADNLFQNSNPFPQTSPQRMNNLYEAEPSVIQEEVAKQPEKLPWYKRNKKQVKNTYINEQQECPINEGVKNDGSFYVFK